MDNSKTSKREVNTTHYLCLLCLVLSNDVHLNPGLSAQQTLTVLAHQVYQISQNGSAIRASN